MPSHPFLHTSQGSPSRMLLKKTSMLPFSFKTEQTLAARPQNQHGHWLPPTSQEVCKVNSKASECGKALSFPHGFRHECLSFSGCVSFSPEARQILVVWTRFAFKLLEFKSPVPYADSAGL